MFVVVGHEKTMRFGILISALVRILAFEFYNIE